MAYRTRKLSHVITEQSSIEQDNNVEVKYDIRAYDSLDDALDQKPDAIFICNPPDMHMNIALTAAKKGCPLFIEKPLSHNYDQVDELIELVESQNLVSFVGYQMRFHPCLQKVQALLEQKAIGEIQSISVEIGEYLPGFHPYEDYRKAHESHQERGGGVILSQIHELDYIYWLFGFPNRVFAMGGHLSSLAIDSEDTASILMEYNMEGRSIPVHLHQDFIQRPPTGTCRIIGDAGKIMIDLRAPAVNVFDRQGCLAETSLYEGFQRNQLFLDEMKHFLECLRRKKTPLVTVRAGADTLRMALAARESLSTGQVIELGRAA
jgi:predicted dehydrogenase